MKSISSLPDETLRVLDDDAMTEVVGGGDHDGWRRHHDHYHHDHYHHYRRRYYHRRYGRHGWWH